MLKFRKSLLLMLAVLPAFAFAPREVSSPQDSELAADWRKLNTKAFQPGEKLVYRVSYGPFTAGTATFYSESDWVNYKGRSCYKLHGIVKSASSFEWFYKLHNEFHSYVDKDAIVPYHYTRSAREGDYKFDDAVYFDHSKQTVKGVRGQFTMPSYTQDMVSAFYYARCLPLRTAPVGYVHRIPVFIDDNVYNLGLTVLGREVIKTKFGKMRTIKISPIIVSDRVFKEDAQMVLWVTDDENMIPVYCESPVTVGSIECELIEHKGLKNPMSAILKTKGGD